MTYIGIAALMAASGWMEALYRTRRTEIRALLVILASVGIGEAIWAASVYANPPKRTVEDPIRASIVSTQNSGLAQKRVYTPTVDATSFAAPSTVRLPSSYMGHLSPNMITARLTSLISQQGLSGKLPESTVKRILNYLTVTSTSYLVLDRYSPLTESLQKSDSPKFADYGELKLPGSTFELFGVPGIIADAYLIPDASASAISVFRRSAQSNTIRNQITLDDETAALATFLQSPHVIPLTVRYPTQESLEIVLPKDLPQTHRTIFLSESYSNAFRATHAKQSEIRVLPAGPYFIKLQLPRDITPASTITLVHRWPTHMYIAAIGIILLILGIGISTLIRIVPFRPKQLLT